MTEVGRLIAHVLTNINSEEARQEVRQRVTALAERFPLYASKQYLTSVG